VGVLLSLAAAVTYGCSDFLGGVVTRRVNVLVVVLVSQLLGCVVLAVSIVLFNDAPLTAAALAWGAAAGVAGTVGVVLLYRGLAAGRMSIVAPVTAVEAASVPVAFGLLIGERPSAPALFGVLLALPAIALVSSSEAPEELEDRLQPEPSSFARLRRNGVPQAVGAGLCFGAFFTLVQRAGTSRGLWPIVGVRGISILVVGLVVVILRPTFDNLGSNLGTLAAVGNGDVAANVFYVLATQRTLLSVAAVLTSLYPAFTVLLATAVLGERLRPIQLVGLLAALAGIALISFG
jgi:drug/metabolite transporter (DMT)-like permease